MTLQDFITQNDGKGLDFDGAYGNQCMDLFEYYNRDVIGNPTPVAGNAIDVQRTFPPAYYSWVANTPTGVPTPGDVVIWNEFAGLTGPAGHIDVFLSGDANSFTGFDQNWPTQEDINGNGTGVCHKQIHNNYDGVAGWLHPLKDPNGTTTSQVSVNVSKAVQFDQSLSPLNTANNEIFKSTDSGQYVPPISPNNDGFVKAIQAFTTDYQSQRNRAGNYDKVCQTLGLTGDTNQITPQQIANKISDNAAAQTATITNLNEQITALKGDKATLTNENTSLQQQLQTAQDAQNEPNSGLAYKDLYNQAESNLVSARQALSQLQTTTNQQIAQLKNTSATTIPLTQLWKILLARQFGLS